MVESGDGGAFFGEGANVEDLCAAAFGEGFEAEFFEGGEGFLFGGGGDGLVDDFAGDEGGLEDHHGPFPVGFVVGGEGGHVIGPPESFEGHDVVVDGLGAIFDGELGGVGDGEEGLDGVGVIGGGVGVALAIDHEVVEGREVDFDGVFGGGLIEGFEVFFDVDFGHGGKVGNGIGDLKFEIGDLWEVRADFSPGLRGWVGVG